ncbi:hypothetical protein C8R46DRAFT_1217100 [Mycena filopes]|nr:hypothetical protein C8R46DRAFT_1217100 [Mycena filopes]
MPTYGRWDTENLLERKGDPIAEGSFRDCASSPSCVSSFRAAPISWPELRGTWLDTVSCRQYSRTSSNQPSIDQAAPTKRSSSSVSSRSTSFTYWESLYTGSRLDPYLAIFTLRRRRRIGIRAPAPEPAVRRKCRFYLFLARSCRSLLSCFTCTPTGTCNTAPPNFTDANRAKGVYLASSSSTLAIIAHEAIDSFHSMYDSRPQCIDIP